MCTAVGGSVHYSAGETGWLRFTDLNAELCNARAEIDAASLACIDLYGYTVLVTLSTLDPLRITMPPVPPTRRSARPIYSRKRCRRRASRCASSRRRPSEQKTRTSLLEKWNAFAPITLPDEARALPRNAWPSATSGCARAQIGFVGMVLFAALNRNRYWMGLMNVLAEYAFFAGVGYQTTRGMGLCRQDCGDAGGDSSKIEHCIVFAVRSRQCLLAA
jgi:hypothetical protein